MRYLVLTDIHANLEALDTCLADASRRGYDRRCCLGDIVGYGADPNAVDRARAGTRAGGDRARQSRQGGVRDRPGRWLQRRRQERGALDARHADAGTPGVAGGAARRARAASTSLIEICHGSPFDEDAYIFDELDAARALKTSDRPLCLFGHTHYPVTFELSLNGRARRSVIAGGRLSDELHVQLRDGCKYLMNPGAVGQPRDGDPRAAYAIVDTDAAPGRD